MKKKILSLSLAIMLAVSLLPGAALAASDPDFSSVSLGTNHAAAIGSDGSLWAWILDEDTGSTIIHAPVRIGTESNWKSVAANYLTIALKTDGSLWMWEHEDYDGGGLPLSKAPKRIGSDNDWASIAAYLSQFMAIKSDGSLWTWGYIDNNGGFGEATYSEIPIRIGSDNDWASVSMNRHFVAQKTDGSLWSWGWNANGQLGDGTNEDRAQPAKIGSDTNWISYAAGVLNTYAVKSDGSLWMWGRESGRIGTDNDWVRVIAGGERNNCYTAIAIKADGSLWYFENIISDTPILIDADNDWSDAAVSNWGFDFAAFKTDGSLWAWKVGDVRWDVGDPFIRWDILGRIWPLHDNTDVPSDWAKDEVRAAIEAGLVPENLQRNYQDSVTRGAVANMFINLVEQASGMPIEAFMAEKGVTPDPGALVDTDDPAVLACNALGIIRGMGDGTFNPDGSFLRAQITVIINRVARVLGVSTDGYSHSFQDIIGHWVEEEIGWPVHMDIIRGVSTTEFSPDGVLTTEQAIAITYRALSALS